MKIPNLKIGHRTYTVEWTTDGDIEADNCWGECDKRKGLIRVATNGRPADAQAETLIHEILHALAYDGAAEWDNDQEEQIVSLLAPRLAAFMSDNPKLVAAILTMLA